MTTPLKPCPFCGKTPDSRRSSVYTSKVSWDWWWRVGCPDIVGCEVHPDIARPTEADAIAAWNRRAE